MQLDGVYTFVTSARSGRILVDGIEASSFGLHHDAANTYYMLHRVGYSVLRAMGLSATVVHDIMTHDVLVATNLFIGDLSLLAAKAFAII